MDSDILISTTSKMAAIGKYSIFCNYLISFLIRCMVRMEIFEFKIGSPKVSQVMAKLANPIHFVGDYHAFWRQPAGLDSKAAFQSFFPIRSVYACNDVWVNIIVDRNDLFDPQKTNQNWDTMFPGWTIGRMAHTNGEYLSA